MKSLVDNLIARASQAPASAAIVQGSRTYTYEELLTGAAQIHARLRSHQLGAGATVLLALENGFAFVACLYGIWLNGQVAVPISPQSTDRDLANLLRETEAAAVFGKVRQTFSNAYDWVGRWLDVDADELEGSLATMSDPAGISDRLPEAHELALIIYTSGTTSNPKGVMLSHGALLANAQTIAQYLNLSRQDRAYVVLPFHFSYGNSLLHSHLAAGASLSLGQSMSYPAQVARDLVNPELTGFSGVPSTFHLLLEKTDFARGPLPLRYITQAGGAMPIRTTRALRTAFPKVDLYLMYGQTEASARLTFLPPELADLHPGSVGRAIPGVQLRVVNNLGQAAPPGEVGELLAQGPNIMDGYWKNPDATAAALKDGWLHTGDLGRIEEDGLVYLTGRRNRQIQAGAYRVDPLEIEEIIAELEFIREVAVGGLADPLLGEAICAWCVSNDQDDAPESLLTRQVRRHCKENLPAFKRPKSVHWLSALPRTDSGKVKIHQLTEAQSHDTNA